MPLILLSCNYNYPRGQSDTDFLHTVHSHYAQAVAAAGGLPVLATVGEPEALAARADGFLLTGGVDISPLYFGESILNGTVEVNALRDRTELALFQAFLQAGKPVFGICRGIQLINVGLGGSLWQDLPAQLPAGLPHGGSVAHPVAHTVTAAPGSRIAQLCGAAFDTNSFHHQAVRELGKGLRAAAHTADGVIEAVEHESLPVWGVQWHPERMTGAMRCGGLPDMRVLFADFVRRCGQL